MDRQRRHLLRPATALAKAGGPSAHSLFVPLTVYRAARRLARTPYRDRHRIGGGRAALVAADGGPPRRRGEPAVDLPGRPVMDPSGPGGPLADRGGARRSIGSPDGVGDPPAPRPAPRRGPRVGRPRPLRVGPPHPGTGRGGAGPAPARARSSTIRSSAPAGPCRNPCGSSRAPAPTILRTVLSASGVRDLPPGWGAPSHAPSTAAARAGLRQYGRPAGLPLRGAAARRRGPDRGPHGPQGAAGGRRRRTPAPGRPGGPGLHRAVAAPPAVPQGTCWTGTAAPRQRAVAGGVTPPRRPTLRS